MTNGAAKLSRFDALCQLIDAPRSALGDLAAKVCANLFGAERAVLLLLDYTGHALFAASAHRIDGLEMPEPTGRFDIAGSATSPLLRAAQSNIPLVLKNPAEVIEFDTARLCMPTPNAGVEMALCPLRCKGGKALTGLLVLSGRGLGELTKNDHQVIAFFHALAQLLFQTRETGRAKSQINDLSEQLGCPSYATTIRREERLKTKLSELFPGSAVELRKLRQQLAATARATSALLLSGAPGSGKEEAARALHEASRYHAGRFVYVDCALFDADLFLAELLGVRRGAVPGRASGRKGYLREASEGTIFLDHLEKLPRAAQGPVFRLIERGQYRPIGAETDARFSGRVIGGTQLSRRKWLARADAGRFDPRFIGKLSANAVQIPEVAACADGFREIATSYLEQATRETMLSAMPEISTEAWAYLETAPWPGQFRQVLDTLRAALFVVEEDAASVILPRHFFDETYHQTAPDLPSGQSASVSKSVNDTGYHLKDAINGLEANLIRRALSEGDGNRARAAKLLNIPKRTLADKCKKHCL